MMPFSKNVKAVLVVAASVSASSGDSGGGAGDATEGDRRPSEHADSSAAAGVVKKLELLETLTSSDKNRQRVASSGNPEARQHLEQAVDAWHRATRAYADIDLQAAGLAISEGYEQLALALRNARDPAQQARLDEQRFAQLRQRVFSFSEAFERITREKGDTFAGSLLDQEQFNQLLLQANRLAANGDHTLANVRMGHAAEIVERALSRARDKETLIQELSFRSLEDEYNYEVRRNESYETLMKLLENGQTANPNALRLMREALKRGGIARTQAGELFSEGELENAITILEKSSEDISRVLQMSGLAF